MNLKKLKISAISLMLLMIIYACSKSDDSVTATSATVTALSCSTATFSATATSGTAYTGTATVPYTGGNAVAYSAGSAISSTGVTGLTATLAAGTLATGAGSAIYAITGTPSASGTASFAITVGGQSCTLALTVAATSTSTTAPTITSFSPTSGAVGTTVTITGTNFSTTPASNTVKFNGTAATVTASTATSLTVTVPTSATTGTITATVGSNTATSSSSFTVSTTGTTTGSVSNIVTLANAFIATLSTTQQASVVLTLNLTNAKRWSNLPCALSCRNGILFSTLTTAQQTAALALIQAASGTSTGEGYNEFTTIRTADDYLGTTASGYSAGNYVIAFLGTPSTTGKWMLQFGGHHSAQNITYDAGAVTSITPMHEAVEPGTDFTYSGTTYTNPLSAEKLGMQTMLASFTTAELASAKISSTFSDCLMVPGSTTNTFPTTKQGIKVSTLSTAAQAKVLAAMLPWLADVDATTAAAFTTIYTNELANTYVTYASNTSGTSGTASSFLTTNTDYVRIDGPSVWIEFICQTGVVLSGIHYHTVFRDHTRDYIGL